MIAILGCGLPGTGLNYLPLLLYAIQIVRQKRAQTDATLELAHPETFRKMYGWQSVIFILIPLALLALAIIQRAQR